MEAQTIVQFPLQKLIFGDIDQNLHQRRYQSFLVLSNFAWFSCFLPNVLLLIVDEKLNFDKHIQFKISK